MAHRRFARVVKGPKRLTSWFQFQNNSATMTVTGGTVLFSLNAAALALRPFTVVRSHFEVMLSSDQAAAIETQFAAFGIAVVSDQASGAGVTALPTPFTDMASDLWFVHRNLMADESNLTDRTRSSSKFSIDSKAMRKVDIGQDIVVVGEFSSGAGGGGVVLVVAGRMLVKVN